MKLPAVPIAIAFASGIAMGFWPRVEGHEGTRRFLWVSLIIAFVAVACAGAALFRQQLLAAGLFSLAAWFALGICGSVIAHQPQPNNYVLNVIGDGLIDIHSPLRWHGTLRDEPSTLPWGTSYEIALTRVDYQDHSVPVSGGLRLTYSPRAEESPPKDVHAGDEVAAVVQARLPQMFRDEGAFDRRAYLRSQGVELTAALRSPQLIELEATGKPSPRTVLARVRRRLRESLTDLLPDAANEAAVLRAMLLGDRSFLDRSESVNFQKTGVFHVLVVAGLHVGAFAAFLFWLARKFRLSRLWTSLAVVLCVICYVAVVEQRPPVLRAALMTLIVVLTLVFFRRVELLNSVAIAATILLVASPALLTDSSFQLSFLSMFCIAAVAVPWLEKSIEPYARGMRGWRDVTRDVSHIPQVAQFRIDLRSLASWIEPKLPCAIASRSTQAGGAILSIIFRLSEMLVLTLVLQIGMLPLLARDFHRITLSGPLANLIAVPLTGILVPLGFTTLLAGLVSQTAGLILAEPLKWLTAALIHVVDWIAHIPRWSYRIPGPPLWLMILFFCAAVILAVTFRLASPAPRLWNRSSLVVVLAAASLMAIYPFAPQWRHRAFELTVLDVGQGDSLFLVSPVGHTILVDAGGSFVDPSHRTETRGPDPGEDAVSPYLWSRGFQQIDTVALTHAHQDHIGGLTAIFNNFKVGTLWIGREVVSHQQQELEQIAALRGTRVIHEIRGDRFEFDGARGEFIWPQILPTEVGPAAKNDDSLVFRVSFGSRSFLLPGDAEKAAESSILSEANGETLQSDVLKIGHHGSKNSTTPDFLAAVRPQLAVISAGEENSYGHPSPVLLERLQQAGVATLRTDVEGAIHIFTDGKRLEVNCFVACPQINARINLTTPQPPQTQESSQKQ